MDGGGPGMHQGGGGSLHGSRLGRPFGAPPAAGPAPPWRGFGDGPMTEHGAPGGMDAMDGGEPFGKRRRMGMGMGMGGGVAGFPDGAHPHTRFAVGPFFGGGGPGPFYDMYSGPSGLYHGGAPPHGAAPFDPPRLSAEEMFEMWQPGVAGGGGGAPPPPPLQGAPAPHQLHGEPTAAEDAVLLGLLRIVGAEAEDAAAGSWEAAGGAVAAAPRVGGFKLPPRGEPEAGSGGCGGAADTPGCAPMSPLSHLETYSPLRDELLAAAAPLVSSAPPGRPLPA
eukprot:142189-Chlamydomonas_euryale.AAC.1